jgi:hypothetical protein
LLEITVDDLAIFAKEPIDDDKAEAMIAYAVARAQLHAPCINDEDFAYTDAAKAILLDAILRWNDSGSGALSQISQTAGVFGNVQTFDTRQQRPSLFRPSEIVELQRLCKSSGGPRAFEVDSTPPGAGVPADFTDDGCGMWWNYGWQP